MNHSRPSTTQPSYVPLRHRHRNQGPVLSGAVLLVAGVAFALALSALLVWRAVDRARGRSTAPAEPTVSSSPLGESGLGGASAGSIDLPGLGVVDDSRHVLRLDLSSPRSGRRHPEPAPSR